MDETQKLLIIHDSVKMFLKQSLLKVDIFLLLLFNTTYSEAQDYF